MGVYDVEVYYPIDADPRDTDRDVEELLGYPMWQEDLVTPDGYTVFFDNRIERPIATFSRDGVRVFYERDSFSGDWLKVDASEFGFLRSERTDGGA